MEEQKGLTHIGLMVIICTVLVITLIGYAAFQKVKNEACRLVCGVNLKGLGTAMGVYASDYNDNYPQLPGKGPWAKELGFPYDLEEPYFNGAQLNTTRSITASWYLLVREADVSPKSFICPQSKQQEFLGENSKNLDLVKLWDFGSNPHKHISYVYHNPYGRFPANRKLPDLFAISADSNPWFDNGNILKPNTQNSTPQIIFFTNSKTWKLGNSLAHKPKYLSAKYGQNILYADGHMSFNEQPNAGINNDNIYTFWSEEENPSEQDIQGGTAPTGRSVENDAKSEEDSFLAI
ncbi:MAG: hypothetical protein ISS71_08415 [Phycisphaerae bacterium]|nr:hypothetical protein [Phycisphaerae bacterium]